MFIKPLDMATLVRLPGSSEIHVGKTKIVEINVYFVLSFTSCVLFSIEFKSLLLILLIFQLIYSSSLKQLIQ